MKMTGAMETSFKLALKKPPLFRTAEVNKTILSSFLGKISSSLLKLVKIIYISPTLEGEPFLISAFIGVSLNWVNNEFLVA